MLGQHNNMQQLMLGQHNPKAKANMGPNMGQHCTNMGPKMKMNHVKVEVVSTTNPKFLACRQLKVEVEVVLAC